MSIFSFHPSPGWRWSFRARCSSHSCAEWYQEDQDYRQDRDIPSRVSWIRCSGASLSMAPLPQRLNVYHCQPRSFETFKMFRILDKIQPSLTDVPTFRAYSLPGGTEPVKTWDLYPKGQSWPDRPFVRIMLLRPTLMRAHP